MQAIIARINVEVDDYQWEDQDISACVSPIRAASASEEDNHMTDSVCSAIMKLWASVPQNVVVSAIMNGVVDEIAIR